MTFKSINPATNELINSYEVMSSNEVEQIINQVNDTFLDWRKTSFMERSKYLQKAADLLEERSQQYGELMTREMGKPIKDSQSEIEKCAWVCRYYADNGESFLADNIIETDASESRVIFQPLGIVFAIMPWNFPFWQVFRFAAPSLMAGNVGILKHSDNVSGCALAIEEVLHDAGFPKNAFRTIIADADIASMVIKHPHVKAVTLTGSTKAGKSVAKQAAEVLKKSVLELGGNDAYIILDDADVETAAETCVTSRLTNSGQSCIAAKRFIVVESLRTKFEELVVNLMKSAKMGDPMDADTEIGPQARHDFRDSLHKQVQSSIEEGAKCLLGGNIPKGTGAFYPPTVLTYVKDGMPAYNEELFGPVAAIIPVTDETEAIKTANDSVFGLGSAIFTQDIEKGKRIASEEIQAGSCFVNASVKSDPRLPFGGIKNSGYGRELSQFGIREFVYIKTVYIA